VTDVTKDQVQDEAQLSAADERVLRELTERARAGGLQLTGEGGLLGRLTKMVIEGALEGELDDHLGYERTTRPGGTDRIEPVGLRPAGDVLDVAGVDHPALDAVLEVVRRLPVR
jgi:putative transposase